MLPFDLSKSFIHIGGEIGVLLLLFILGLEYTGDELKQHLRNGWSAGIFDFLFNFVPGLAAGFLLMVLVAGSDIRGRHLGLILRRDRQGAGRTETDE